MKRIDRNYQKERDYHKVISFLRRDYEADPYYPGWKAQRFEDISNGELCSYALFCKMG